MAIHEECGHTWPEQNAIDEFFSHKNLLPLKEAVTAYRLKVQAERDHFEKLLREAMDESDAANKQAEIQAESNRKCCAEVERLRALLLKRGAWKEAPCCICGYNGPGYFQPENHPCAALGEGEK